MSLRNLSSWMFGNRSDAPYEVSMDGQTGEIRKSSRPNTGPSVAEVVQVDESSDEEFQVPEKIVRFDRDVKGRNRDSSPGPGFPISSSTPSDPPARKPLVSVQEHPFPIMMKSFPR